MAVGGTYRIDDDVFPAPVSTQWEEQVIASMLDGRTLNSQYRTHTWNWPLLDCEVAKVFYALYDAQQAGTPISELETDSYDADLSTEKYGTEIYTNVVIVSVGARTRGLPFYDDVTIVFEVLVN